MDTNSNPIDFNDEHLKKTFPQKTMIVYNRSKNISDYLIRARLKDEPIPSVTQEYPGTKFTLEVQPKSCRCTTQGCLCCTALQPRSAVTNPVSEETFPSKPTSCNCQTKHTGYIISCRRCGIKYRDNPRNCEKCY